MTAVLASPSLYLDRPAQLGDRVNCGAGGSWLSLIGRVVDLADPVTGRMRIVEEHTGTLVYVDPARALVFAPAYCPTCGVALRSLLATCREPACLAADLDVEAVFKRGDDR